jgi:hypothetical protein
MRGKCSPTPKLLLGYVGTPIGRKSEPCPGSGFESMRDGREGAVVDHVGEQNARRQQVVLLQDFKAAIELVLRIGQGMTESQARQMEVGDRRTTPPIPVGDVV